MLDRAPYDEANAIRMNQMRMIEAAWLFASEVYTSTGMEMKARFYEDAVALDAADMTIYVEHGDGVTPFFMPGSKEPSPRTDVLTYIKKEIRRMKKNART